jgi:hypothetical protein
MVSYRKAGSLGHPPMVEEAQRWTTYRFGKLLLLIYLANRYGLDKLRAFTPLNKNLGLFCSSEYRPGSNLQWSVQE